MKSPRFLPIAIAALVAACVIAVAVLFPGDTAAVPRETPPRAVAMNSQGPAPDLKPDLDRADAESRQALERQLRRLDDSFAIARTGVPRFVDEVFGYESQIALIRDQLPWSSGQHHATHLRRAFHIHVLDPAQLDALVQRLVADTLDEFREIDDALLVRLRRDLENLPASQPPTPAERDHLIAAMDRSLDAALAQARPQVARAIAAELTSVVAAELVTWSILRGAAIVSAPISLGVSLTAYVAADQAMSWAIGRWADPRGHLIRKIDDQLGAMRRRLLDGSPQAPGLRSRLEQVLRERSADRRQRILNALRVVPAEPH